MILDHFFIDTQVLPLPEETRSAVEGPFFWTPSFGRGHWRFFLTEEGLLEVEPNDGVPAPRQCLADASGTIAFSDLDFEHFFSATIEKGRLRYLKPIPEKEFEQSGVSCFWYHGNLVAAVDKGE